MVALHNEEYEQVVLGILLRDPEQIDVVNQYLTVESFYFPFHRTVYKTILSLISDNTEVSLVSVGHEVSDRGQLAELYNSHFGDPVHYCTVLRDLAIRRTIFEIDERVKKAAGDVSLSIEEVVEKADSEISSLLDIKTATFEKINTFLSPALQLIEERFHTGGISGVETGYSELDRMLGGLQNSDFILIGARTSIGKTAFALNIAENIAKRGVSCGFLSLEMSGKQVAERLLCGSARVTMSKVNAGVMTHDDFGRLFAAAERINEYPLYIYDQPNASLFDIKLKARRMVRKHGIKVLFVDYLSLIHITEKKAHWEKMMDITRELKALARELSIPIVALSQVTRDAEGKAPSLADLRYGGSLEQDADVVLLLHREREGSDSELHVKKQRQGPCGKIPLFFNTKEMRFYPREEE